MRCVEDFFTKSFFYIKNNGNLFLLRSKIYDRAREKVYYGNLVSISVFLASTTAIAISFALAAKGVIGYELMAYLFIAFSIAVLVSASFVWMQVTGTNKRLTHEDVPDGYGMFYYAVTLICALPIGYGAVIMGIMPEIGLADLGLWEKAALAGGMAAVIPVIIVGCMCINLGDGWFAIACGIAFVIGIFTSTMLTYALIEAMKIDAIDIASIDIEIALAVFTCALLAVVAATFSCWIINGVYHSTKQLYTIGDNDQPISYSG